MPEDEITLDNILNTGVNSDQDVTDNVDIDKKSDVPATTTTDTTDTTTTTDDNTKSEEEIVEENKTAIKDLFTSYQDESTLDDNQKSTRQELLKKYNGTTFDENGNIVDKDNKIVGAFNDIYDYLNDDTTTTDKDGNVLDVDGNVIKTAYEVAVENTVVNKIAAESGYELKDENGNPKIYTDDDAGFNSLANDLSSVRFNEFKQEFFGQNKELTEIAKHILGGGTVSNFKQDIDYSTIDAKTISKDEKIKIITDSFLDSGLSKERANDLTTLIIDSNSVDAEFDKAKAILEANQDKRSAERDIAYQAKIEEERARVEQHWKEVEDTISNGDLGIITIPEEDKTKFNDYLSLVVDNKGNSQDMLDAQKETKEQKLTAAFLRFKGYDMSALVKKEVGKQKMASLKERLRKSANIKNASINDANKSNRTSGDEDITISSLLGK